MQRAVRVTLMLVALSLLLAPIHILLAWPRLPTSLFGWVVLLFLTVPLAVLGEWLLQYRDIRFLRPIDSLATRVASSPYRLPVAVACVVVVGAVAFALLFVLVAP
ncbi:MAG: hypothetical protein JNK28_05640 [Burkholderiaceae bacterium]|mgnify:CR=1 FL=1|nr:hypothetical protein [Burkholderiaceae bacterium]